MVGDKRRTLVTGATRGIGRAIVDRLMETGHEVIGIATRPRADFPCPIYVTDLSDEEATQEAIQRIRADGPVDHLVNNAGISATGSATSLCLAEMRRLFEVNVRAPTQLMKAFVPDMMTARYGRIVNIGSKAQQGRANVSAYAATKAALEALTVSWALEWVTHGITVNLVAPGAIQTDMVDSNNPIGSERRRQMDAMIPAGRIGRPEDVAEAVAYFLSTAASYTTGQSLHVCGGWSLPR